MSAWRELSKLKVTAYWEPLVKLVKGREDILFTWSQVKSGKTQDSFNTPIGFTSTLNKIHGTSGELTLKLPSEILLERGQFSLKIEGSTMTGLTGEGPKIPSISSKTFKLRV